MDDFLSLEDYGIIGNQETCALVGRNGSVDWLPIPFMDSPSVFASILDLDKGGTFSITPVLKYHSFQRYLEDTNILVTEFSTATGEARITDFMPAMEMGGEFRMLLRKIEGTRRDCVFKVTLRPRFEYGRLRPILDRHGETLSASAGDRGFVVHGIDFSIEDTDATATITVGEGEERWVLLMWSDSRKPLGNGEPERLFRATEEYWRNWSRKHDRSESVQGELAHDLAMRSALALKLLINPKTGSIAAAATLALPESVGGIRNWDYRFAWIRDASFTAQALFHLGYPREAKEYRRWVMEILRKSKDLSAVRPLYPIHEEAETEEGTVEALGGYRKSSPIRVGNKAVKQTQLDLYGEVVNTVYETVRYGHDIDPPLWNAVQRICDYICENWREKDRGIWEMRTEPQDYVHSKLMCWVALDRGIRMWEGKPSNGQVENWRRAREDVRRAILEKGYSKRLRCFVQSFEAEDLDATALLIPIHGFLPPDDPRVQSTIDVVWRGLSAGNGLLYRYNTDDGLAGKEGAFILCSFWLVTALAVLRRIEEADRVFQAMLRHVGPLGLYSEEVDPRDGKMIGNFPQAISHIGLINAALHLGIAKGRTHKGPPPQSEA